jgi:hypothetical protein
VNRGDIWPMTDAAGAPFTLDHLAGVAASALGVEPRQVLAQLGDDSLEALEVLLPALEGEARLTVLGRWITHRFLGRLVEQRLALEAYVRADPGVRDEVVAEPWFIIGAPRTGTTILYGVLVQDERLRAPEGWEVLRPAPPPSMSTTAAIAERLALADTELRTPQVVSSGLTAIHEYSGRMPKECLSSMSLAFRSEEIVARYDVPTYVAWLQRCDMRPAYEMHRLVLQVLQRGAAPRRWLLKSPVHLQSMATMLAVYPDARVSLTHRDPLSMLPSVSSLIATLRSVHSDDVDLPSIGRYHAEMYGRSLDELVDHVDSGLLAPERTTSSRHREFIDDAPGVVRGIYDRLGIELTEATADRMRTYLAEHAHDPGGHRPPSLDELGLDPEVEAARFERYSTRFGVATSR